MKSRPRYVRRLQLRSGGEVSLSIEAESGELSGPDASFVMSLIDALDRYQAAGRKEPPKEEAADA